MAVIHTILDSVPPARSDDVVWNRARVEQAAAAAGPWATADTITLDPLDPDPASPIERDLTFESSLAVGYFRVVWLDAADNESVPSAAVYDDGVGGPPATPVPAAPFRYTTVASLRAFTSIPSLKTADEGLLVYNIIPRAEAWIDAWGPFRDNACPQLAMGANILAEFIYEMNDPARRAALYGAFKSESMGNYSYTLNEISSVDPQRFTDLLNEVGLLIDACVDVAIATPVVSVGSTQVFAPMRGYEIDARSGDLSHTFDISQETRYIRSWLEQFALGDPFP
jgi:hypothetical protein